MTLAETLGRFMDKQRYSVERLSWKTKIPTSTINNWVHGVVLKPHRWQDLVKIAKTLQLNEDEANELLLSSRHKSISELRQIANTEEDRLLLLSWPVSFQVPPIEPDFIGRVDEINKLESLLQQEEFDSPVVVSGLPAIGKTQLAIAVAHLMRSEYTDGILYRNMESPDTMHILQSFAHALGRDVSKRENIEDRSRVFRESLTGKRMLIVLDDVHNDQDVYPLLPAFPSTSSVLITTRRRDLWTNRVTNELVLEPLSEEDVLKLFEKHLGANIVTKEQEHFKKIGELLGNLPLAVAIAARQMAIEPDWTTQSYLQRIQSDARLDSLSFGDRSVRRSFNTSYEYLPAIQQRFFATLGIFEGDDFSVEAAAAAFKITLPGAKELLRALSIRSLVQHAQSGRYYLHPLLCDYAQEIPCDKDVYERMVIYFTQFIDEHSRDHGELEPEAKNIFGALDTAIELGMSEKFVIGVNAIFDFLELKGYYARAEVYLQQAQKIAENLDDSHSLVKTLLNSATISEKQGQLDRAEAHCHQGIPIAQQQGNEVLLTRFYQVLGVTTEKRGDYEKAAEFNRKGLTLAQKLNLPEIMSTLLLNLGSIEANKGNYIQAEKYTRESLEIAERLGLHENVCLLFINLGAIAGRCGDHDQEKANYEKALDLAQKYGFLENESLVLMDLGVLALEQEQFDLAEEHLRESLQIAQKIGHQERICGALDNLAAVAIERGQYDEAENLLQEGLEIARRFDFTRRLVLMLLEYSGLYLKRQQWESASRCCEEALEISKNVDSSDLHAQSFFALAQIKLQQGDKTAARENGRKSQAIFEQIGKKDAVYVKEWVDKIE